MIFRIREKGYLIDKVMRERERSMQIIASVTDQRARKNNVACKRKRAVMIRSIEIIEYICICINEGVKGGSIYLYRALLQALGCCCLVWYKSSISLFVIKSKEFS